MMTKTIIFDYDGTIHHTLGIYEPAFRETYQWLTEQKVSYLSTPCVYLCSLGFLPLGLPADDVFWTAPLSPWTSIKAFSGEEFPIDKFMKP